MMKKALFFLLPMIAVLSLASCKFFDSLFYTAPSVSSADLDSYTGTVPSNEEEVLTTIGPGGYLAAMTAFAHISSDPEIQDAFSASIKGIFSSKAPVKLMQTMLGTATEKSISVTQSGLDNNDLTKSMHLNIVDEEVDTGKLGATGTMSIDKCKVDLEATMSNATPPATMTIKQAEVDVEVSASDLAAASLSAITINTAKVYLKAKETGSVSYGSDSAITSMSYDASASLKAGFSISGGDKNSGKFIIETSYYDSGSLTKEQLADYGSISKNLKLSIVIKVYDNSNQLVNTYAYDQNDLSDYIDSSK